ncbi:hypothetical protein CBL_06534 [Carabus blaptoides fortunei]
MSEKCVAQWTKEDTKVWLENEGLCTKSTQLLCDDNDVDGKCLLALSETDFRMDPINKLTLRDRKVLYIGVKLLQHMTLVITASQKDLNVLHHPCQKTDEPKDCNQKYGKHSLVSAT